MNYGTGFFMLLLIYVMSFYFGVQYYALKCKVWRFTFNVTIIKLLFKDIRLYFKASLEKNR